MTKIIFNEDGTYEPKNDFEVEILKHHKNLVTMEPKYYTPAIEEFHVGFEYETCYLKDDWGVQILSEEDAGHFFDAFKNDAVETEFRVKALDREDIEECSWEHDDLNYFKLGLYHLMWLDDKVKIWIEDTVNAKQVQVSMFWGTIRNKSELKMIMRMIGINR